jgi:hypothetical protein
MFVTLAASTEELAESMKKEHGRRKKEKIATGVFLGFIPMQCSCITLSLPCDIRSIKVVAEQGISMFFGSTR